MIYIFSGSLFSDDGCYGAVPQLLIIATVSFYLSFRDSLNIKGHPSLSRSAFLKLHMFTLLVLGVFGIDPED